MDDVYPEGLLIYFYCFVFVWFVSAWGGKKIWLDDLIWKKYKKKKKQFKQSLI